MQTETIEIQEPQMQVSEETANKVFDVLTETGLNWSVRKEELVTSSGLITPNAGIFRNDNNAWLGTVSKKYTPYQNQDLVTTIVEASEHIGLSIANGGALQNGKRVFVQLELRPEFIGNSEVKRYITALNSHNGLASIAFGSSNTVVACSNTFFKVYSELQKFRHHSNAHDKIKLAILELKNTIKEDVRLMETFKLMSSLPIQDEIVANVVKKCFSIDLDKNQSELTSRQIKKTETIISAIETEQKLEGNTLWGLFNGITRFTNHHSTSSINKQDYVMAGQGYITNLNGYNSIIDWIEKNTAQTVDALI